MTDERLCTLTDLNDKARSLAKAAAELMQADKLFSTSDLHTDDQQKQLELWDLLRLHNTCGSLLFSLIDIFDRVDAQLDAEDMERTTAAQLDQKQCAQDAEMLCVAICPQRMKPDGIPGTETAAPKTCAEQQKKGKSGGAQK